MEKKYFDIRKASLNEFEDFMFDHEVHSVGSDDVWYHQFDLTILFDPQHSAECFCEMFEKAGTLFAKYDRAKLEQGCWAMFGAGFKGNLPELIWESEIPIHAKDALIESMFFVYRDLFARNPLGHACMMWWDGLAYDIHPSEIADTTYNPSHKRIQHAMFLTLTKILGMESPDCQFAALHGMNHVAHPLTRETVMKFISDHPELSAEDVEYAEDCANGRAM